MPIPTSDRQWSLGDYVSLIMNPDKKEFVGLIDGWDDVAVYVNGRGFPWDDIIVMEAE